MALVIYKGDELAYESVRFWWEVCNMEFLVTTNAYIHQKGKKNLDTYRLAFQRNEGTW